MLPLFRYPRVPDWNITATFSDSQWCTRCICCWVCTSWENLHWPRCRSLWPGGLHSGRLAWKRKRKRNPALHFMCRGLQEMLLLLMQLYWRALRQKPAHTHTFRCEKHSLSLFSKTGKVPSKLSWYVFFFIEVGQTKPGLLIHSICVIATLWLHRKKTVRVRFANTAAAAQSHTVWWHTHPLFRTRINTHQSSASFNF